jgi:hypothetical protein
MHLYIRMNPGHPLGFPFWVNLSRSRGDLIGQLGKRRIFCSKEFSAYGFSISGDRWWTEGFTGDDLENKLVPAISPILLRTPSLTKRQKNYG